LCGIPWIVKNSETLINTSKKVLGKTLTMWVIKKTFFAHFCAGENEKDIQPVMDKLRLAGIGCVVESLLVTFMFTIDSEEY
jgi:proline dehydrogenase